MLPSFLEELTSEGIVRILLLDLLFPIIRETKYLGHVVKMLEYYDQGSTTFVDHEEVSIESRNNSDTI